MEPLCAFGGFEKLLDKKYKEVAGKQAAEELPDQQCPKCGKNLIIRFGRFGKFMACTGFPECRYTEALDKKSSELGIKCPKCLAGDLTEKRTKKKKIFYGCDKYPDCDFALWDKPTGDRCAQCDSMMIEKYLKKTDETQVKCSNKECASNKKAA